MITIDVTLSRLMVTALMLGRHSAGIRLHVDSPEDRFRPRHFRKLAARVHLFDAFELFAEFAQHAPARRLKPIRRYEVTRKVGEVRSQATLCGCGFSADVTNRPPGSLLCAS